MRESEQPGRRGQTGTIKDSRPLWGKIMRSSLKDRQLSEQRGRGE